MSAGLSFRSLCRSFLLVQAFSMVVSPLAEAHPHSWIDMQSELQIDEQQRLTALRLSWLFDEFYSATILDDAKAAGHTVAQELQLFGHDTITNLAKENYLNRMTLDGQKVSFGQVSEYRTQLQDGRIRFDYTLPLKQPLPLSHHQLLFAIYDSTYYVEMLHQKEHAIRLTGPGAQGCHSSLRPPNPTDEQRMYAISLDKTDQADEGLGSAFAEQISVTCVTP
ncbi:MAG: DUF1007 family protein [Aeromonadaceae bacterium]